MSIIKRGETFYLRKRVPRRYASVESRSFLHVSLNTDSRAKAREKAEEVWREYIQAWEAQLAGDQSVAAERFSKAQAKAKEMGFRWMPAEEVARLPVDKLVSRVQATRVDAKTISRPRAEAVLGGVEQPAYTVSSALEDFWKLAADRIRGKSQDQIRRWRNPRIKAVRNFIKAVGDLPLQEITANDMLDFREWWWERIEHEGLTPNSANKDFTHLGNILKTVCKMRRLGFEPPVSGLSFSECQ